MREGAGTDFGLSTTGIAGPPGATPGKPVGLVYVSAASRRETLCRRLILRGGRAEVRDRTCKHLLNLLRLNISA